MSGYSEMDEDAKPLTYSQRFKQECSTAASLCFWDRIVESFKVKGKDTERDPPAGHVGSPRNKTELQEEREAFETQLENQREHFQSQLQDKDALLAQQQADFQQKLLQTQQDCDEQLEQAENMIQELRQEVRQSHERSIGIQNISELIQQYEFVVPNFTQLKQSQTKHTTPPMYSHPGGYKFILEVTASAQTGVGADVSVRVFSQIGEYDGNLSFPAKMNIQLELLNQENKKEGHHTKFISCACKASANREFLGAVQHFISFPELEKNADIYLKNNQLWFRIKEIKVDRLQHK